MKSRRIALPLTLLAFAVRIYGLSFQPLWGDEGWSFYFASKPLPGLLSLTAINIHPPLYYILLKGWSGLAEFGPETARFLSALFGTITIPAMYVLGTELVAGKQGQRLGLISAGITALAPLALYYSHEVRMYSLVTWLGLMSVLFFVKALKNKPGAFWPYIIFTALTLYSNYLAGFIVVFEALYLLWRYRLRHKLIKALLWTGALYLPWILFAANGLRGYVSHKVSVEQYAPLNLYAYGASFIKAFSLGHLSEGRQEAGWLALFFAIAALLGGWYFWQADRTDNAQQNEPKRLLLLTLYLLLPILLGWLVNLRDPFTPRYFERTLLFAAPAWWMLISGGLLWLWQKQAWAAWSLGIVLLAINLLGIYNFHTIPRYQEQDYRPLMAEISARALPGDNLLASYQWQAGFYQAYLPNPKPNIIEVPQWGQLWGKNPLQMEADLKALLANGPLWFPAYQAEGHIWEDQAEAILAQNGFPAVLKWYNPQTKFSLVGPQADLKEGPDFNFANRLQAQTRLAQASEFESGRGIIPVEINWTALAENNSDMLITLKLVDSQGLVWAKRDTLPQADQTTFASLAPAQSLTDRHGLLVSAGTPPGSYKIELTVTDKQSGQPLDILDSNGQPQGTGATLGEVSVYPPYYPLGTAALAVETRLNENFANQLNLVGYSIGTDTVKTGDTLPVNLFWQSAADNLPHLTMFVQLQDEAGRAVALTERPPVYPTGEWTTGTLLRDVHALKIPPTLKPGRYALAVGVLQANKSRLKTSMGDQIVLETIIVESRPHNFTAPAPAQPLQIHFGQGAALTGYGLNPAQAKAGDTLTLNLYWQVEQGFADNWAIFAHLLDEGGNIVAQKDQPPGNGAYPTASWLPGEYITDTRQINLPPNLPPGNYRLEVGLYNPLTFERVPIASGGDSAIIAEISSME